MPKLPERISRPRGTRERRECPAHRAWVRRHHCVVPECDHLPIECAHVRRGTGGGMGLKPSDRWVLSLCRMHHAEQHRLGENLFEVKYALDLAATAEWFAKLSPHRKSLMLLADR